MASRYEAVKTADVSTSYEDGPIADQIAKVSAWKFNIKLGCVAAITVFVLNLCLFVWTLARGGHVNSNGVAILFSGDCNRARDITIWSHLVINILSSLLLAAGNTCMQCLTAPTRADIDKAHSEHKWLDVGVHAIRNVKSISGSRRFLWACMGLSTIPLHLLYNSVIFEAKVVNGLSVTATTEAFVTGAAWNHTRAQCFYYQRIGDDWYVRGDPNPTLAYLQDHIDSLVQLDNAACIKAYGGNLITDWGNLLIITDGAPYDDPILNTFTLDETLDHANRWVCDGPIGGARFCDTPQGLTDPSEWKALISMDLAPEPGFGVPSDGLPTCEMSLTGSLPVKRCLAQPTPGSCQIGVSPVILGVVLACNLVKIVCLCWTFWKLNFEPLVTLGDAIASFLERPDESTIGCGPMSADVKRWNETVDQATGHVWKSRTNTGFDAASRSRWIICSILFVLFWALALFLLINNLGQFSSTQSITFAGLASSGIGRLNVNDMLYSSMLPTSIIGNIVIANTPQLLVSLLYLQYNDLFTRIHLAAQWSKFSTECKPLRLLSPRKDHGNMQRRDYFLSLPFRISVPLLVAMTVLHWLVSQSLFLGLIGLEDYTRKGVPVFLGYPVLGLGWSPFALVLCLILGGSMILGLWVTALVVRYSKTIPMVRTCSAAISAACHPPGWDTDAAKKPVHFGVVQDPVTGSQEGSVPGHATFTSGPTTPLIDGELYR